MNKIENYIPGGVYALMPNNYAQMEEEVDRVLPGYNRSARLALFFGTLASALAVTIVIGRGPIAFTSGPDYGEPRIDYVDNADQQ